MNLIQDTPHEHRFRPTSFDAHEKEIIIGALNKYGVGTPGRADEQNLTMFTWDQVQQALLMSRRDCVGDSRDDVDDVIYNLRSERKTYVH
jgi:hypothetical protein